MFFYHFLSVLQFIPPLEEGGGFLANYILKVLHQYESIKQKIDKELKTMPEGRLLVNQNKGVMLFQNAILQNGKYIRKGITRNKELVHKLARKEVLSSEWSVVEKNSKYLKHALDHTKDIDPKDIIASMRKAYQLLPPEYFFNSTKFTIDHKLEGEEKLRMQRHVDWANMPYRVNNAYPEEKNKMTSFGLPTRSKSEQLIAEKLHDYGVPFRYDALYTFAGTEISPDFTFQDKNMKLFFWEHAGQMDNSFYEQRHNRKIAIYRSVNIVPWNNLIVTYEYKNVLNMGLIDAMIEKVVIPRL